MIEKTGTDIGSKSKRQCFLKYRKEYAITNSAYKLENFSRVDYLFKESMVGRIGLYIIRKQEYMEYLVKKNERYQMIISTKGSRTYSLSFQGVNLNILFQNIERKSLKAIQIIL